MTAVNRMVRGVRAHLLQGDPTGLASADVDTVVEAIRSPEAIVVPVISFKTESGPDWTSCGLASQVPSLLKSPMADVLVPRLTQAVASAKTDPALAPWSGRADLATLAGRLAAWDRRLDRDSGDAVAFTALMWFAAKRAVEARMPGLLVEAIAEKSPPYLVGVLRNIVDGRIDAAADFLPEGVNGLLLRALDDVAAWLMARFGTLDTTHFALGDVLAAEFPTPFGGRLDVGRSPIGGGVDTIDVAPAPFFQRTDGALAARHDLTCVEMALYRMVIGFDDDGVPRATYDLARGASEQPDDRHFGDLHARWLDAQHTTLRFRRAEVEAATESTVVLR